MGEKRFRGETLTHFRINFVVEGQTEEVFVNTVLQSYFAPLFINTAAHSITTQQNRRAPHIMHRGGLSTYRHAYDDIKKWTKREKAGNVRFTTMFDLYGLPDDFPGYEEAAKELDPYLRVSILERAFKESIGDWRFIPYIQLHEFESLLFSDLQKLGAEFPDYSENIHKLTETTSKFSSPELINDGVTTAPSKRIIGAIPDYKIGKATWGSIITSEIGIPTLKSQCLHFREWIEQLASSCT